MTPWSPCQSHHPCVWSACVSTSFRNASNPSTRTLVSSLFILLIFSGDACKWKFFGKRAVLKEELSYTLSYIDLLSYLPTNVDIHRGSLSQAFFHKYKANWCKTYRSGLLCSTAIWRPQPAPSRQASLSRCVSNDAIHCGAADRQPFLCRWNTSLPQREAPDARHLGFYKCALIE